MTLETILRLLKNFGLNVLGVDSAYIYIEDPSCILRGFETFLDYAWIVIVAITGFLLFGWAVSLIRGAKTDIMINIRNLLIMFMALGLTRPIVNAIWGGDLFARGCKNVAVPISEVYRILDARNSKLAAANNSLYEDFQIYDSGDIYENDLDLSSVSVDVAQSDGADVVNSVAETKTVSNPVSSTVINVAEASSSAVVYVNADGTKIRRTGGTKAWRNNNPGNIRYSGFIKKYAIANADGFAVFPDAEAGKAVIKKLLRANSYNNLTINGAIARYAPASENDTRAYQNHVARYTKLDMNRIMKDLSDEEIASIVDAICKQEGYAVGSTERI